jgi:uncharacterized protein (TIGR02453 family)
MPAGFPMPKTYFTPDVFVFLKQLKKNNRRDWFLKNKERYEDIARQPCLRFVGDLSFRLRPISSWLVANPKPNGGSLLRIYRDIRFSSDKTPYKTNLGMHFPHAGSRDEVHGPSLYFHIEPGASFIAGGCWRPDKRSLAKIRDFISWNAADWKKATRGLELGGSSLKRPPRGYPCDHPMIEDIKRTDFIASIEFTEAQVCSPRFLEDFVKKARKLSPLLALLAKAEGMQF